MEDSLKQRLLDFFDGPDYEPLTALELEDRFQLPEEDHERLLEALEDLEEEGRAVHLDGRGWFSPSVEGWRVGRLTLNRKGFGFVRLIPDDDRGDVFVDPRRLRDAHDRDLVLLETRKPRKRGPKPRSGPNLREGRVLYVLRRSPRLVVGRYYSTGDAGIVEPIQHDTAREIHVAGGDEQAAEDGARVMVRISEEPAQSGMPSGEVIVVLGEEQSYEDDLKIIVAEFGLSLKFPEEVQKELESLPSEVGPAEIEGRVDRRDVAAITIDPDDARDFDDAVVLERTGSGDFRLGVFIADVAAYVAAGSAIDREALRRGTSVYLPGRVVPMLPPRLSNDLCSLRPDVDRLARGVWMTVTAAGELKNIEVERAVIRSRRRFTYGEVQALIDGESNDGVDADIVEMVHRLNDLRSILRSRRRAEGALELELDSQHLCLDEDGNVARIEIESTDESHQLIEECMLLANEAVARIATKKKIPILRRVHPEPSEEDVETFIAFCQTVLPSVQIHTTDEFQKLVDAAHGKPAAQIVNFALLRTLTQAQYAAEPGLHFALAKDEYCHFTSPIRRYPDLQVHRAFDALYFRDKMPKAWQAQLDGLDDVAARCSERERRAEQAERDMTKLRVIAWLRDKIGERFKGIISAVLEYGFFVRLDESLAEGMVHVRNLGEDFFEFHERDRTLRGRSGGQVFRLGDPVEVELLRADSVSRQVDFRLVESEEESDRSGGPRGGRSKRGSKKRGKRDDSGVHGRRVSGKSGRRRVGRRDSGRGK